LGFGFVSKAPTVHVCPPRLRLGEPWRGWEDTDKDIQVICVRIVVPG
jgi:hypothetical protein